MLEALLCLIGIAISVAGIVALQIITLFRAIAHKDSKGIFLASFSIFLTAAAILFIYLASHINGC